MDYHDSDVEERSPKRVRINDLTNPSQEFDPAAASTTECTQDNDLPQVPVSDSPSGSPSELQYEQWTPDQVDTFLEKNGIDTKWVSILRGRPLLSKLPFSHCHLSFLCPCFPVRGYKRAFVFYIGQLLVI